MARVKILIQPSGCLNGYPWPEAGEEIDLPDDVAEAMAAAGHVERVKGEPKKKVETRPSKAETEKRA